MPTYLLFRLAGILVPHVPRRLGYALIGLLAPLLYGRAAGNRRMLQANVRHVLGPDADAAEVDRVARRIFLNLIKNYFDLFWLPAQPEEKITRMVAMHGYENVRAAIAMGKGVVLTSCHLGNQELMSQLRAFADFKMTGVVEHMKNERVFKYLTTLRQSSGIHLIPQDGALRELLRALKRGEVIGLAFDRDVTDSGRIVPLFGSPAKLPDGYAILALKHGVPVLPAFITRQADDTYAGYIDKPMTFQGSSSKDEDVRRVMVSVGAVVENYLRTYIDQWVYFHYIWEDDKERLQHEQQSGEGSDRAFGKADLHIHSLASDGLNSPHQILEYVEEHTDLDVIAIADHDGIEGALEAKALHVKGRYSFEVVVAEEITTLSGHLLAVDIKTCIRMFQSLEKTIAEIHAQGGLAIVPHPLAWFSSGLRRWRIESIMSQQAALHFDGMETFNPSVAGRQVFEEASALTDALHLARVGGSDSHSLDTIGSARTIFPGRTWPDLRQAVEQQATQSQGEYWEMSDYTRIALPQAVRSLIILPGKRIKKMAGWFLEDRGYIAPAAARRDDTPDRLP